MAGFATPTSSNYVATDGAAYEKFLGRWTWSLAPLLIDALSFDGTGPLLDVGCGTGSCAANMSARFPGRQIVGIDVAEDYVAFARSAFLESNLEFKVGDVCAIPYRDGYFDGAVAQLVINFVPDAAMAAHEMKRVTRSGGIAGACVWDFRGGLVYQRLFWDTAIGIDPNAAKVRDKLFSDALALPDGLTELWHEAGFAEVERFSLTSRMDYANFEDYWEPLFGGQGPIGTYAVGLPTDCVRRSKKRFACLTCPEHPTGRAR